MKTIKICLVVNILFFISLNLPAQTNFNIELYKSFLQANKNLTSEGLMQLHPAGKFIGNLNLNYNSSQYFDSIAIKYNLTDAEKSAIRQNGFMVSERLSEPAFGKAFLDIFQKDLPVFVSTDAVLHAFHRSYDRILKDIEVGVIIDSLTSMLRKMQSGLSFLDSKYSTNNSMQQMLQDVDVYTTVACHLMGIQTAPYYPANASKINDLISLINSAAGIGNYSLFTTEPVLYDWSQFKPRGHYDDNSLPVLASYFRTMMWFGRIEIYLLMPNALNEASTETQYADISRETIDAMLIKELYDETHINTTYHYIESILKLFVGDQDNVTIDNLDYLKNSVNLSNASDLLDSLKLITFQDTLRNQAFANQLILSQLLTHNPLKPDSIIPASAFLLFGQRFVIDSYITSQVVYDRTSSCRLMPSMLDPMFALGNDASAQLLKSELDTYSYSGNLASLRYLINSYGTDFWQGSMYNLWLNSIRTLNPPLARNILPPFMQTGAFWQEKLNTQLSSWTQLRHDNLLYAKQSYTAMTACSFPFTYIEPFPDFYRSIKLIAQRGLEKFDSLNIISPRNMHIKSIIHFYFDYLYTVCDTLISISEKELNHQPFTDAEISFLRRVVYNQDHESGSLPYDGWYARMFYDYVEAGSVGFLTPDNLVADVHTVPTDCSGNQVGWVKEVGTGPINLGVFVAQQPNGQSMAFIGPVMSFYEYTTTNFQRLTDQEWNDTYLASSLRPSWTNLYLLDAGGNQKSEGLNLITSVDKPYNPVNNIDANYLLVRNYPNPFNPATTISFQVPAKLSNADVELTIYNINGQIVKRLLHRYLSGGNYLARWDATNDAGISVASGTYICNLKVGNMQKAGKIVLLK
jgi:hypothetical protein